MQNADGFICIQKIGYNQYVLIFRKYNLSERLFKYDIENQNYFYEYVFKNRNSTINLKLTIKGTTFYKIFYGYCKNCIAIGNSNNFDISIRTRAMSLDSIMYKVLSITIKEETSFIKLECFFKGVFNMYQMFDSKWNVLDKNISHDKSKAKTKMKRNHSTKRKESGTIKEIPFENINVSKVINTNVAKNCKYYQNKICIYYNDVCNPNSIKCKNKTIVLHNKSNLSDEKNLPVVKGKRNIEASKSLAKTIVISENRKCIVENHILNNISAIIRVLQTTDNKIIEISIPAAYCEKCNQYIILKHDFKTAKKKGVLLCEVIDKTHKNLNQHKKQPYSATESRIHALGYNVIKQCKYTFEQRKIILLNAMENYGISQQEILSMLDTNISRKKGLPSYLDAVDKWMQDREFISNYKKENQPEMVVEKVIIGSRN